MKIVINKGQAIEQVILSLGALPCPESWNIAAVAEKIVNELYEQSIKK